ncbi:hypothetical protein HYV88_05300 [Candidatus Woesearchaeota archaeon]|nr:hypothetical protein [Candidatus Woesearchaeota archaeon]
MRSNELETIANRESPPFSYNDRIYQTLAIAAILANTTPLYASNKDVLPSWEGIIGVGIWGYIHNRGLSPSCLCKY